MIYCLFLILTYFGSSNSIRSTFQIANAKTIDQWQWPDEEGRPRADCNGAPWERHICDQWTDVWLMMII